MVAAKSRVGRCQHRVESGRCATVARVDERALRRKAELAELLLHVAREFGETLEPEPLYDRFHELLADVVQHDGVVVSSYDDRDDLIRCEYAWVDGNRVDPATFPPLPLNREGGGMQSRVIVTGEPLLFNDVAERVQNVDGIYYVVERDGTMRKVPDAGLPDVRAAMMVPVKHEGRVVGVVQLMSDRQEYVPEHLEIVEGLVGQMAAAVRNARLQKERRRLEAAEAAARAVAAEREQAAQVLEAVGDGVVLVDRDGVVRLWNDAAELITGLSRDEICRRPLADAFPDWQQLEPRIPIRGEGAPPGSVTLPVTVGGADLWLALVAVRGADGVVYTFRDVTRERQLEEEKSDFLATISHELRTPMTAVYGASLTLLRRGDELRSEDQAQLLQMIVTQAARLSQITEEVLLTTQLDRNQLPVQRQAVDVAELARAAVEAMRPHADPASPLELEVAPEVGRASGDPDRIQQVVVNLLDNALKYGRGAPVEVRVDSDGEAVRITVADTGPGIAPTEQQRIFEKFYRSDPQLTNSPSGTGLGLYISRELVQRMGGRLDVRSQPGAGATFVVELPRA